MMGQGEILEQGDKTNKSVIYRETFGLHQKKKKKKKSLRGLKIQLDYIKQSIIL